MLYDALLPLIGRALRDNAFMGQLLADPNGVIRGQGIDIGKADVKLDWVESTNCLNIYVENGGANWTGGILLKLVK